MSMNDRIDWIAFYEEFADKLLEYKDNRNALVDKIKQVYEITGINMPTLDRDETGENVLIDIDPFTVFGLFNKGITKQNRIKIITAIKSLFSVNADVPTMFDGIPVLNNQKATFYWFIGSKGENDRGDHDIDNLWDVFSYAIGIANTDDSASREGFTKCYNLAIQQKGVKWNLSMGLFWIRPNRFINLDSRNRWFFANGETIPDSLASDVRALKGVPSAEDYLTLCDGFLSYVQSGSCPYNTLSELSHSAWAVSKQDDDYEKITEGNTSNSKAKFLRWFKPLLQALRDLGGRATPKEARDKIIQNEHLSADVTESTVGKNNTPEFNNDVAWAREYLRRAGYIDNSERGVWLLTETGWTVDMTDELATEIFREVVKKNQSEAAEKGTALADEDVDTQKCWIYSPGKGAEKWEEFYEKGIMAIGWGEIGDLSAFESRKEMIAALKEAFDPSLSYRNDSLATWQFSKEMKVGDIVFVKRGTDTIIGRGVVDSDYFYDESIESEYKNVRKVRWINKGEWAHPGKAVLKALTDITSYTDYVEQLNELFETEDDEEEIQVVDKPLNTYTKSDFLADVYITENNYDTLVGLLRKKKNVILTGAPGVGKTFAAKRLAYSMMGVKDPERVHLVQFHQSYSYEDFVEGFRPSQTGLNFEIKKGAFYTFCKTAADDKENDYFFIIDEINRGNLSKIFGELFMLIEDDKRGNDIQLLYSSDKFSVPKNVYIIGMMNTADRSLAMIDYALRRRFAFYEMKPAFESEGFKEYQYSLENDKFNRLIDCIVNVNQRITDDDSLGEGFCIGHSYFCNLEEITGNTLSDIIEYEIIPLLKEYWFDEPSKVKEWSDRLRSAIK